MSYYVASRAYQRELRRRSASQEAWEAEVRRAWRSARRSQRPPLVVQLWIHAQREHRGVAASLVLFVAAVLAGLLPDPYGWLVAGTYGLLGSLALRDAILQGVRS